MSADYCIAYEDRAVIHTSRWALDGLDTQSAGNTSGGWLWMNAERVDETVTVSLYKDAGLDAADKVAEGTAEIGDIDTSAARCVLAEANGSGLGGELHIESFIEDAEAVPVLTVLCTDPDLADEYTNLAELPAGVYDAATGMARHCTVATRKVLLLASQMYADQLGGFGAPEHRHHAVASRTVPDFRRIVSPDQLKDAAVHWALMLAFGACHERAAATMYSQLRDYHDAKRREAIAAWNLTINIDPDWDDDADQSRGIAAIRPVRL